MESEAAIERLVAWIVAFAKQRGEDLTAHPRTMQRVREEAARAHAEWRDAEAEISVPLFMGFRDGDAVFTEASMPAKKLAKIFTSGKL